MPELILYKRMFCPYCNMVLEWIAQNWPSEKPLTVKDTRIDAGAEDELMRVGGKSQVPCLFIDDKPLYESADIIAWLDEHK
ncbi:MAG: glutaredoxin [Eggerthellaceae bacterium]|nr:glutaredoxin [Eggerthellaceae bacterium]